MKSPLYLDNQATTQIDPRVLEKMMPYLTSEFGNASSKSHPFGWAAEKATQKARLQVAELVGASEKEVIFTSGATESNNLAILGVAHSYSSKGKHIITTKTEHKSVLDICAHLETQGFRISYLPVDRFGQVNSHDVAQEITSETILVSIIGANNEIGTINHLSEIGRITSRRGVLFHSDCAQAAGKIPLNIQESGIDLLSLSAHKNHGPKGIGALIVRSRTPRLKLSPLFYGGGQEKGLRPGTLNVPAIVGFGEACEISKNQMQTESRNLSELRDRLQQGLLVGTQGLSINGHAIERLPGNLNFTVDGVEAEELLGSFKDIALSSGSACTTASIEPSHVLLAIGLSPKEAHCTLRIGLSRFTTVDEVDWAGAVITKAVKELRGRAITGKMEFTKEKYP